MSYLDKLFEWCLTKGSHISIVRQCDIDHSLGKLSGKAVEPTPPISEEVAEEVYNVVTGNRPSKDITHELL